jgi:hypothetical protein
MIQLSKKNPDRFLKRALHIVKTGFGQPSIFNTDSIVQELVRQGKRIEDARCGGASVASESGAFGKEAYILTGISKSQNHRTHASQRPRSPTPEKPSAFRPAIRHRSRRTGVISRFPRTTAVLYRYQNPGGTTSSRNCTLSTCQSLPLFVDRRLHCQRKGLSQRRGAL